MPLPPLWLALGVVKLGTFGYMTLRHRRAQQQRNDQDRPETEVPQKAENRTDPSSPAKGPVLILLDEKDTRTKDQS